MQHNFTLGVQDCPLLKIWKFGTAVSISSHLYQSLLYDGLTASIYPLKQLNTRHGQEQALAVVRVVWRERGGQLEELGVFTWSGTGTCSCTGSLEGGRGQLEGLGVFTWSGTGTCSCTGSLEGERGQLEGLRVRNRCNCRDSLEGGREGGS